MKLKAIALAGALLMAAGAQASMVASVTVNAGAYTLQYNPNTTFGWLAGTSTAGNAVSFEWAVPTTVGVMSLGGAAAQQTFQLPDFTITANPGYTLSGLTAGLGNIVYTNVGTGAATSITASGNYSVNGGATVAAPWGAMQKVVLSPNTGYFADSSTLPVASFNSFALSGGAITLSASGGAFASIQGQPQNKLTFSFNTAPVPEPETYALMLAGFRDPVLDRDRFTLTYDDLPALMRELRAMGATNALHHRRHTLTGRARFAAAAAAYEPLRRADGKLPSTWDVIYAHAWAPPAGAPIREQGEDIAAVPLSKIPIRRRCE